MSLTEATVLGLLRQTHERSGNGGSGEHAFLTHVRNAAGFDANRTFDAVSVNLWPSRGLAIHVFEVKVSRSDWRRELDKPDKAEDACRVADRFSVVAPKGCVKDGELPPSWGLIEVLGDGGDKPWRLRVHTAATLLREGRPADRPVSRAFLVGLLRSCPGAIPGGKVPGPDKVAIDAAYARGVADERAARDLAAKRQAHFVDDERATVTRMREALHGAGVARHMSSPDALERNAATVARALNGGEVDRKLEGVRDQLRRLLAELDSVCQ